jgi:hypothetical protein
MWECPRCHIWVEQAPARYCKSCRTDIANGIKIATPLDRRLSTRWQCLTCYEFHDRPRPADSICFECRKESFTPGTRAICNCPAQPGQLHWSYCDVIKQREAEVSAKWKAIQEEQAKKLADKVARTNLEVGDLAAFKALEGTKES